MSPSEKMSEKIKQLPHMSEEHLAFLEKNEIMTPEALLSVIDDKERWKGIHSQLKGVGPKTVEKWKEQLNAGEPAKPEVKEEAKAAPEKKGAKKVPAKKVEEKEESVEVVEEGDYVPAKKPKLTPELKAALKKRKEISDNRPAFYRQEYGRRQRLQATGWRKPRGIHSKTRMKMRYRRPMVSIGYGGPDKTRGLHPSGFQEVRVFNVADLEKISDADTQAARIAHGVGQRKRELIAKKADELGIRILNRS